MCVRDSFTLKYSMKERWCIISKKGIFLFSRWLTKIDASEGWPALNSLQPPRGATSGVKILEYVSPGANALAKEHTSTFAFIYRNLIQTGEGCSAGRNKKLQGSQRKNERGVGEAEGCGHTSAAAQTQPRLRPSSSRPTFHFFLLPTFSTLALFFYRVYPSPSTSLILLFSSFFIQLSHRRCKSLSLSFLLRFFRVFFFLSFPCTPTIFFRPLPQPSRIPSSIIQNKQSAEGGQDAPTGLSVRHFDGLDHVRIILCGNVVNPEYWTCSHCVRGFLHFPFFFSFSFLASFTQEFFHSSRMNVGPSSRELNLIAAGTIFDDSSLWR